LVNYSTVRAAGGRTGLAQSAGFPDGDPVTSIRTLPDAQNRRAHPRTALRGPVTVVHGGATFAARTWDVALDGVCLLTPRPISPGTRCKVSFQVPLAGGPRHVTVTIKVVYSSYAAPGEFKIGAVFTDLDEVGAGALGAFTA